ncbi:CHAT domain-containing protein [Streptomyces bobili]|uniref:CHAT domain-containing protein n=1 Tax=Streptomyces bobili TaxID=67280 RepID=UPI00225BD799|nr:CHAT domain-containing protein [Streptomyces bobili]MCX5524752.1 CHAT domain-containing protein [Streptomyces bobili]
MNTNNLREELAKKSRERAEAERKATEFRRREASERALAAKARSVASAAADAGMSASPEPVAHHEARADLAARGADRWSVKAAGLGSEVLEIEERLAVAEPAGQAGFSSRAGYRHLREGKASQGHSSATEVGGNTVFQKLPTPRPEKLRLLMLGAGPQGELRVAREQSRIRSAVRDATHRDWVEMDLHPAATPDHLLTGLTRFRPHVVHFSGHSSEDLLVFEKDLDRLHRGATVTAEAFARALAAVDDPPVLVVLNSCASAAQAEKLIGTVPFAIGMSASIGDMDAIAYAARFYATLCEGQSLRAANAVAKSAIELAGLTHHDLPTLFHAPDVNPAGIHLVKPPAEYSPVP